MSATYSINGVVVEWPEPTIPTAGDLKKLVGTTDGYVVTVIMPDGTERQLQDHEKIPQGVRQVSIFPGGIFAR
jgi:hypothetical protein